MKGFNGEPEVFSFLCLLKRNAIIKVAGGQEMEGFVNRVFAGHLEMGTTDNKKIIININHITWVMNLGKPEPKGVNAF